MKVIQDALGHKDVSTTLNIYTDVTKELRKSEFEDLNSSSINKYWKNEKRAYVGYNAGVCSLYFM